MPVGNGDVIQAVLRQTMLNGDEAVNVFVWRLDKVSLGDLSDAQAIDVVEACLNDMWLNVVTVIASGTTFDTIDLYKRVGTIWDYLTTGVPSITPSGAVEVLPGGVAMLATAYTLVNKVFGRKFLYGVTESGTTGGVLNSIALTALANFASSYQTAWQSGAMGPLDYLIPGVWSTKTAGFQEFGPVAVVKNVLSYQRRRKANVGV